uniref:Putative p-selectin n=1 Tax=Ornithodoros turicata TaxID=34597 RepID=A0A2R5LEC9_9ACAR
MSVLRVLVLAAFLRLGRVMCSCSCESMSARMSHIQGQVDSLRQLVNVLNMKVGDMVKKDHESTMAELRGWGQHMPNTIPVMDVSVKKEIQKLDKRVTDGKERLDLLENYMLVLKNDNVNFSNGIRKEMNATLMTTVKELREEIINGVISPKLKLIEELSRVPDRLEKMEKWMKVDGAVLQLLEPSDVVEGTTESVLEIYFVDTSNSSGGNFSVNVTGDGHIVCASGTRLSATEECLPAAANDTESFGGTTDVEKTLDQKEIDAPLRQALNSSGENLPLNVTEDGGRVACASNASRSAPGECLTAAANGTESVANATDMVGTSEQEEIHVSLGQVLNALMAKIDGIEKRVVAVSALENELAVLSEKMNVVERNVSELNFQDRRLNSEASTEQTLSLAAQSSELEPGACVSISNFNGTVTDLELHVQNLTDRVEHVEELRRNEENVFEMLMLQRNRTDKALAEALSRLYTVESTALDFEDFKNATNDRMHNLTYITGVLLARVLEFKKSAEIAHENMTASIQQLSDNFERDVSLLNMSIAENVGVLSQSVMKDVVNMNRTLQKRSIELSADVGERIRQLNTTLEGEVLLLNASMMNSVVLLNDSLKNDVELLNDSLMNELEMLNNTMVERVVTLSKHVEMLNETLRDELDVVNVSLADGMEQLKTTVMNMGNSQHAVQGWHPNDSLPCPGLLFLGRSKNLVLTTENGTFRSPNLPEDPIPAERRVVFRCEHPGLFQLKGEQVLKCFSGRWSSRPPTCEPLPTMEELRSKKVLSNLPSITYNASERTGLVINKYGVLVVTPGVDFELTCLYPKSQGFVTWKHNNTVIKPPAAAWASGADSDYAFMLKVAEVQESNSGTYTCVSPSGHSHSVEVQVEGVQCDRLEAPGNGSIEITKGSTTLGSRIEFHCQLGFRLAGDREVTCVSPGVWSANVPACEAINDYVPPRTACTPPKLTRVNLGIVPVQTYYADKAKVSFVCNDGRRPVGKATSTCMKGRWMGTEPMCD